MPPDNWLATHVTTSMMQKSATELRALYQTTNVYFGDEAYAGTGIAINSENSEVSLNWQTNAEAKKAIIDWLEDTKRGMRKVNYKLPDWLFSRPALLGRAVPDRVR